MPLSRWCRAPLDIGSNSKVHLFAPPDLTRQGLQCHLSCTLSIVFAAGVHAGVVAGEGDTLMGSPTGVYAVQQAQQQQLRTPGGHAQGIVLLSPGQCQQRQQQLRNSGAARVLHLSAPVDQPQRMPQSGPAGYATDTFRDLLQPNMAGYAPAAAILSAAPQPAQNIGAGQMANIELFAKAVGIAMVDEQQRRGIHVNNAAIPPLLAMQQSGQPTVVAQSVSGGGLTRGSFKTIEELWRWWCDPGHMRVTAKTPKQMEEDGDTSWRRGLNRRALV